MYDPRKCDEAALARMIYGSNMLESAGNYTGITHTLCQAVFRGEEVSLVVDERDPMIRALWSFLRRTHRPRDERSIIKSCREVVQHARAVSYAIDHVVINKEPWSEELIRQLHRILHVGLDQEDDAGHYRAPKYSVFGGARAKLTRDRFVSASDVPCYMKELVRHLNRDIARADAEGGEVASPYATAARYHHQIISVFPFEFANGRIARIILNTVLWRLGTAGVCEIGVRCRSEVDEYVAIANKGAKIFREEDGKKKIKEHTGHLEMAKFVARTALECNLNH